MKYNLYPKSILFFALLLFFTHCNNKSVYENLGGQAQTILRSDEGIFRGIELDVSMAHVENTEVAELLEKDEGYLLYTLIGNGFTTEFGYYFDGENKLNMIKSNTAFQDVETLELVRQDLIEFYNSKIGKGEGEESQVYKWEYNVSEGIKGSVEITLETSANHLDLSIVKYYEY